MKNGKSHLIIIFLLLLIIIIIFCLKYRKNRLESFYQVPPNSVPLEQQLSDATCSISNATKTYTDPITKTVFSCNGKYNRYNSSSDGSCPTYLVKNSDNICIHPQTPLTKDLCDTILDGSRNLYTFLRNNRITPVGQMVPNLSTNVVMNQYDPRILQNIDKLIQVGNSLQKLNNQLNCPKQPFIDGAVGRAPAATQTNT